MAGHNKGVHFKHRKAGQEAMQPVYTNAGSRTGVMQQRAAR